MRLKEAITNANTGLDAIKRAPVLDYPTDLRCIRIQDISQAKPYEEWAYTETSKDNYKKFKLAKGDILVARTGATVGVSYYVNKDLEAVYNNGTIRLKINEENDSRYIFYITTTKEFRQYIDNVSCVATQPNLRIENLLRFQCPDKDLEEQKAIASVLSAYDDLIEKNNRKIEILQDMAEELYKEWFVRFRFPGYKTAKFTDGIPEGWEIKQIKDFGQVETGKTPSTEVSAYYGSDILFVKTPDMHNNMWTFETEEMLSIEGSNSQIKKLLPVNSIMVSCIGTGGVVSINSQPSHTNQQINSIILNDINNLEWLYYTCITLKPTILLFGATGATMTNLSKGKFEKLKVLYPGEELIELYHNKTAAIFTNIKNLMYSNKCLKQQRDLLLPRLMSGKLAVEVS